MANYEAIYIEAEKQVRHFLAPLEAYFKSPTVNEIMVNNAENVFIEEFGKIYKLDVKLTPAMVASAINAIMSMNRKDAESLMDARLPGLRVAAVLPPIAVHGPAISIRKHSSAHQTCEKYLERGDFDQITGGADSTEVDPKERLEREAAAKHGGVGLADLFRWMMATRQDVAIAGGTSSGKTTIGGAFLDCIPDEHRIITAEDTNELVLRQPNVLQLEANIQINVSLRKLVKMCLRLRPDRIIVGEVRGAELFDLIDAMNTGHPGAMFTVHANSAYKALTRLENLLKMSEEMREASVLELRGLICQAVDYVVYNGKRGKSRAPEQVIALDEDLDSTGNYRTRLVYTRQASAVAI